MLNPRIIVCLLLKNNALYKTVKFKNPKYIGDPLNAVRIFNEKQIDELLILDIDATKENRLPNFDLIKKISSECQMPLCYGGGIKKIDEISKLISLGVEKVALSSALLKDPNLIKKSTEIFGSQSIIGVLDIKKKKLFNKYEIFLENGTKSTGKNPLNLIQEIVKMGVGEIVINSIDRDGTLEGYDFELIRKIKEIISIPLTVLGGASSHNDFVKLFSEFPIIGGAAGSLFVLKGKYKAVLIQYPNIDEKEAILYSARKIYRDQN